jgi:hypothetical protein
MPDTRSSACSYVIVSSMAIDRIGSQSAPFQRV